MLQKIKNIITVVSTRITDVSFLGQAVFAVLVLLVSWSGVKSIQTNYELQKQISGLEQERDVQKLKNDNLKLKNEYLNTDEFLELAARRQFGKAAPGEKMVVIPKTVAMKYTKEIQVTTPELVQEKASEDKPGYQKNLEAWSEFLFRSGEQ